jgi:hypothetical protein
MAHPRMRYMADTRTSKNPLTGLAVLFAIGLVYEVYKVWTSADLFSEASIVKTIRFLILYFRKSRYAVEYFIYSIPPIWALYFGLREKTMRKERRRVSSRSYSRRSALLTFHPSNRGNRIGKPGRQNRLESCFSLIRLAEL